MVSESFQPRDPNGSAQPTTERGPGLAARDVEFKRSVDPVIIFRDRGILALAAGGVTGVFRCLSCVDSGKRRTE